MRAIRAQADGGLLLEEVPVPDVGPGAVLVRVAGAGLCHSDCLISARPQLYGGGPFTIGHETAGWIEALGDGVHGLNVGEPVVVHCMWGCGACAQCRAGNERFCTSTGGRVGSGMGHDGGVAEYLLVPSARHVVPLGDIDPTDAGPLDDAALTPYHAMRTSDALGAGAVAVVIGAGGLGHMAIQLLRALTSATVVAVETDATRRAFATELGADLVLDPADDAAARIKRLGRDGATFVLDLVGTESTLALAAAGSARGGDVALIGVGFGTLPFSLAGVPFECRLRTSLCGEVAELAELVALAQAGRIQVHATHLGFDDVVAQIARLDQGQGPPGRAVVVPA